ncbi:asparagine synthase (glutamine-hydrolyzing) [Ascidiimonas sp. W6]|uniref:asparagine synthase (glutamine-hydrolyzing) n=1 Tax=Ascidiimonas meishanensis TaxID=3128903 RepID=UPI0030EF8B91
MCGIFGEFFTRNTLSSKAYFRAMNNRNTSRGPDAEGYWSNGKNCSLGFRRLAILDLSETGNQPMQSQGGRFNMVFNGEIYNYREIRRALEKAGIRFRGSSDSEVILNAFEVYGIHKTVKMLDGMFAIALFDTTENALYLIRDFAGIKPLFYSFKEGDLVFGSSYDQIADHQSNTQLTIDPEVLQTYMRMHYIPAPYGLLKHTFQVAPGQWIKFDTNGKQHSETYWELPDTPSENLITHEKEALAYLDSVLSEAVKAELVADVPVGSFLSGGIDSPLVTKYANTQHKGINTFTIGSDSKVHDESEDAATYAKLIGCSQHLIKMDSGKAAAMLLDSMTHLGEPFADFSLLPTYLVAGLAKKHCTVVLSGDGGDELFFGYERFYSVLKNYNYRWLPQAFRYPAYAADKLLFKNKHLSECITAPNFAAAHQGLHSRVSATTFQSLFPEEKGSMKLLSAYQYSDKGSEIELLCRMRKAEFYGMMQKTLIKADRMSMAHSLELRVPFLKKTVIEAALKIHPMLSYGALKKKEILKKLLKQQLPKAPIDNRKRGFTVPLAQWLREELKHPVYEMLKQTQFIDAFGISENALEGYWKEHQQGKADHKWLLFTLYSLATWQNRTK